MELFKANKQWSTRPEDERFPSIQALYDATKAYYESSIETHVKIADIRTEANGEDVQLVGKANVPAKFTHFAFGQLLQRIGSGAGKAAEWLRSVQPTLAAQNVNYGLKNFMDQEALVNLLFHKNGSMTLRSFTSEKYSRIWNYEVAERLLGLEQYGWKPAMADMNVFGEDFPDIYASDRDCFTFLCNDNYRVAEEGNPDGLKRGIIVSNSEVGDAALDITKFLYRRKCGNHIIWGASRVSNIKVRHVGDARNRWYRYNAEIQRYLETSASDDEAQIASAKKVFIGYDKEATLDKLFGMKSLRLSRKTLEAGYDAVNVEQDGDPNTVWGTVQGLTRHSQTLPYADDRVAVDTAAGKLLDFKF